MEDLRCEYSRDILQSERVREMKALETREGPFVLKMHFTFDCVLWLLLLLSVLHAVNGFRSLKLGMHTECAAFDVVFCLFYICKQRISRKNETNEMQLNALTQAYSIC